MFSVLSENRLNRYFSKTPSTLLTLSHLSYFLGQDTGSAHIPAYFRPNPSPQIVAGGNHVD